MNIKSIFITGITVTVLAGCMQAVPPVKNAAEGVNITGEKNNYIFSYFTGNGEDGLHLAYSHDGFKWRALNNSKSLLKPEAGNAKLMRDPCILLCPDGIFRMVWTTSWKEKGIGYAYSADLINWSAQKYIPVMEHEPGAQNCWAPEIFYDDVEKQYLVFWSTAIDGQFTDFNGEFGKRIYYVTTKDFESFSETRIFYDPGFNVIDAAIVKDENKNRYVMFLKDEANDPVKFRKNIIMAYSKYPEGPYGKPSLPITGNYQAEGQATIKIGGTWFVYFDKYMEGRYGLLISKNLRKWKEVSEKAEFPDGIRHGTAFEVSKKVLAKLLDLK